MLVNDASDSIISQRNSAEVEGAEVSPLGTPPLGRSPPPPRSSVCTLPNNINNKRKRQPVRGECKMRAVCRSWRKLPRKQTTQPEHTPPHCRHPEFGSQPYRTPHHTTPRHGHVRETNTSSFMSIVHVSMCMRVDGCGCGWMWVWMDVGVDGCGCAWNGCCGDGDAEWRAALGAPELASARCLSLSIVSQPPPQAHTEPNAPLHHDHVASSLVAPVCHSLLV